MKNHKILLKILQQSPNQGISLTELLVALVISGIVLTATASGFMNILRANRDVESKSNQLSNLTRALTFIQEDIKQGVSVEAILATSGGECDSNEIDSEYCLLTKYSSDGNNNIFDFNNNGNDDCSADDRRVVYGFQDIHESTSEFLKPGVLKRDVYCTTSETLSRWEEVADGLISVKENDPTSNFPVPNGVIDNDDFCRQNDANWTGDDEIYGADSSGFGGFRFCLDSNDENNRLARIFLYGHIIGSDTPMNVDIVTFARSQPEDSNDDD